MSDDNVIRPQFTTHARIPVDQVLDAAKELEDVLVLGWLPDGTLYAACSSPDAQWAHFIAATFQHALLAGDFD